MRATGHTLNRHLPRQHFSTACNTPNADKANVPYHPFQKVCGSGLFYIKSWLPVLTKFCTDKIAHHIHAPTELSLPCRVNFGCICCWGISSWSVRVHSLSSTVVIRDYTTVIKSSFSVGLPLNQLFGKQRQRQTREGIISCPGPREAKAQVCILRVQVRETGEGTYNLPEPTVSMLDSSQHSSPHICQHTHIHYIPPSQVYNQPLPSVWIPPSLTLPTMRYLQRDNMCVH